MSISPGARIGPYEVLAPLGRGGMGVVFRARDTTLHRDVALKLLPDHLASDPDRLSRFEREAQLLASLNHPNIAQIYGQERADGSGCIVMELVEGDTLAEHLAQRSRSAKPSALGPRASTGLALDEALEIARQIAAALEAAHARGIVHRDLKPANIKLTPDGKVKVLDFGLAIHGPGGSGSGDAAALAFSHSPTVTRESMPGVMLGTLAYMSPEQARGKPVDARTDIWAFGCVLYEMLTGHQAFDGETATDVVARVITGQPDWDRLPPDLPSSIRLLLTSTLNKDPTQRLQNIGDARLFFDPALVPASPKQDAQGERRGRRGWLAAGGLGVALVAALVPALLYFRRAPTETPQIRFEMAAPGIVGPVSGGSDLTISPDGQRVAYVASVEGKRTAWIRPIGAVAAQPLAGTEGAAWLFWSPDSRYLGFFADGKLKKIDVSGGPAQVLCDAVVGRHGAWNRDNVILFTVGTRGLGRVSASGGEVTPVTTVDASTRELFHTSPEFLPDGRHFLYIGVGLSPSQATLYAGSLDTKSTTHLMALDTPSNGVAWHVRYAAPGHLLFLRNRTLMAQPFDQKQLAVVGAPVPLADGVSDFAASDNGVLVYQKALAQSAASSQLVWFDRSGRQAGPVGTSANYGDLELAPDGQRVAVDIQDVNRDIWVIDVARATSLRLTFDPATDWPPIWAPDGSRVAFASNRGSDNRQNLYQKSSSGVGTDELLFAGESNELPFPEDWSPDGRHLVFARVKLGQTFTSDLWALPLFGDKKAFPLLQSSFWQVESQLSPDGRWFAFTTNESGTHQIVVQPFPDPNGGKWQISANGGIEPKWRRDGRELYYLGLDGKMMAVPVTSGTTFEFGQPSPLFQALANVPPPLPVVHHYDVTADGQRFLVMTPVTSSKGDTTAAPITAVVNWTAGLSKK